MSNLVVINGEADWQSYFPGIDVQQRYLQTCQWLLHDGHLWALDASGTLRVDAVLWRVGAIRPHASHRTVLEMLRLAGIPCVNPVETLLRGYDRLAMRAEMARVGLPLNPASVALGERALGALGPVLPAVVKFGNLHGGWGKARIISDEQWEDVTSLAFAQEDYVTVEPYLEYRHDLRCLVIGERAWGMARQGRMWKANTNTLAYELVTLPPQLPGWTQALRVHLCADILAVDFLEVADGSFVALEYNDTPGFSGFPDEVRVAAARCVRERMG